MRKLVIVALLFVALLAIGCQGEAKLKVVNDVIAMDVAEDWVRETGGDTTMLGGIVSAKHYPYTCASDEGWDGKWVVTYGYYPVGQSERQEAYATIATRDYVVQEIYWSDDRGEKR